MVNRPVHMNAYEFVVLAALRAQQLLAGCLPRLEGDHSAATMAQMEVAGGRVTRDEVATSAAGVLASSTRSMV
jgi:DNA-directed RNA polymerase subunit K/omega